MRTCRRRNKAPSGGAIRNAATISFVSDRALVMQRNTATEEVSPAVGEYYLTVAGYDEGSTFWIIKFRPTELLNRRTRIISFAPWVP